MGTEAAVVFFEARGRRLYKPEFSKFPANVENISKETHIKKVEDNDVQQTR